MYIARIPKHVPKPLLPGLKVGGLVKTCFNDYSQGKDEFESKPLPAGSLGRVKKIWDFGPLAGRGGRRFYCEVKIEGHPITSFYSEELVKVRV
jgi:hypothetical protein